VGGGAHRVGGEARHGGGPSLLRLRIHHTHLGAHNSYSKPDPAFFGAADPDPVVKMKVYYWGHL